MLAIKYYGGSLEYASNEIKNNKNISIIAIRNDIESIKYMSDNLKNNIEIIYNFLNYYGYLAHHKYIEITRYIPQIYFDKHKILKKIKQIINLYFQYEKFMCNKYNGEFDLFIKYL